MTYNLNVNFTRGAYHAGHSAADLNGGVVHLALVDLNVYTNPTTNPTTFNQTDELLTDIPGAAVLSDLVLPSVTWTKSATGAPQLSSSAVAPQVTFPAGLASGKTCAIVVYVISGGVSWLWAIFANFAGLVGNAILTNGGSIPVTLNASGLLQVG